MAVFEWICLSVLKRKIQGGIFLQKKEHTKEKQDGENFADLIFGNEDDLRELVEDTLALLWISV